MEASLYGSVVIFTTWDNPNCYPCLIDLIISWVFAFSVCLRILEGSNPIFLLKFASVFVVVVVVVAAVSYYKDRDWVPIKVPELTEEVFTIVLIKSQVLIDEFELTFFLDCSPPVKGISIKCFVVYSIIKKKKQFLLFKLLNYCLSIELFQ